MKFAFASLPAILLCTLCYAADSDAPNIAAGDTWRYQDVSETASGSNQITKQITVTRVADGRIEYTLQQNDVTQTRTAQADWGRVLTVNGQDRVIDRPLFFPVEHGQTWNLHSAGPVSEHGNATEVRDEQYSVDGVEMVNVAAGRFKTFRIEAQAQWTIEPGHIRGHSSRTLWYAPDAKRWVKAEETTFDANDQQRAHVSEELVSMKVAP
ncbi:hypothetical protein [Silvimonas iriomotensis]|uniref:Uncharacterized protein n=1 Tax=Silvimonas iriomotensis TaxID=449662 RepID=A0ABQ2P4J9_9NEIS|nr:hypothetical protein [Silvimonas iriomotensis]GGP18200.1 hypothetical protein GCM10010970_03680 [Silvimonas iriomotensis]